MLLKIHTVLKLAAQTGAEIEGRSCCFRIQIRYTLLGRLVDLGSKLKVNAVVL